MAYFCQMIESSNLSVCYYLFLFFQEMIVPNPALYIIIEL